MARAQGKDRENTRNLVLIGAWQPCCNLEYLNLHIISMLAFGQDAERARNLCAIYYFPGRLIV